MLLVNKPSGITSFDVIRRVKKQFPTKKLGHVGTLDKEAEGLLILLIGPETKHAHEFVGLDKTYIHIARIGIKTDTGDLEGKIIKNKNINTIDVDTINSAISQLQGEFLWQVPLYSATKVKGKPLYKYARENMPVIPPTKQMCIYYNKLLNIKCANKYCDITLESKVSSGTFIRTLNEKLGDLLNLPSTTAHIKRTQIGEFKLSDAIDLDAGGLRLEA